MEPLTRFESSVLGPVGTSLGKRCLPYEGGIGEVVLAIADLIEEPDGTCFVVQLTEQVGPITTARVRVEEMGVGRVAAVPPFADADGDFVLEVPLVDGHIFFFVANPALQARASASFRAIARVVLLDEHRHSRGHIAFAFTPRPSSPLSFTTYAHPFTALAWAVARADGRPTSARETQVGLQLETVLGGPPTAIQPAMVADDLGTIVVGLRCRFAALDQRELLHALIGIAAADGTVTPRGLAALQDVAGWLGVTEETLRRWAHRMGVDLPAEPRRDPPRALVDVATDQGRRVSSVTIPLARRPREPRNRAARAALVAGLLAVLGWFGSVALVLVPEELVPVVVPAVGTVQLLVPWLALGLGWLGLRTSRDASGLGRVPALAGLVLGASGLILGCVWWSTLMLGMGIASFLAT
ncbi:MAG: hypothetical protein AAF602_04335 [Myxococcota bacterium]